MTTKLFKDGDRMAIQTDAPTEDQFMEDFSHILADMADHGTFESDWDFQFRIWLPQVVEVCCAYRGYKTTVSSKRQIIAATGDCIDSPLVAECTDRDIVNIHWHLREAEGRSQ